VSAVEATELVEILQGCTNEIALALADLSDWSLADTRPGQYRSDLVADDIGVRYLVSHGFGVLSEESGIHNSERELFAVIDPIDGSTNASRHLPWFATSICVLDATGPLAAVVVNQATHASYSAYRGQGAYRDGHTIAPSAIRDLGDAMIGISGYPRRYLGWSQFRALGAIALDLCAVAEGALDGYLDCVDSAHGPWDYLAGMLICREAGAVVGETAGRELVVREHTDRRSPVAGGTPELMAEIIAAFRDSLQN
jgi:myo-inositol-1(or 4)-monophosphatase